MKRIPGYDAESYARGGSFDQLESARIVAPHVVALIHPKSVVDIGCGSGGWLAAFRELGVQRCLGLDGANVDPAWLRIPVEEFRSADLSMPFELGESFDLALCLEVAEHVAESSSTGLVSSLVKLAPYILFSAAVPRQGGAHHVNEQWPDYWAAKFEKHGYKMLDVMRGRIWKDARVQYWYRQNLFMIVRNDRIASRSEFREAAAAVNDMYLIHKDVLARQYGIRGSFESLSKALWGRLVNRFKDLEKSKS